MGKAENMRDLDIFLYLVAVLAAFFAVVVAGITRSWWAALIALTLLAGFLVPLISLAQAS